MTEADRKALADSIIEAYKITREDATLRRGIYQAIAAARREMREEAARECDKQALATVQKRGWHLNDARCGALAAERVCAAAIRSLPDHPEPQETT